MLAKLVQWGVAAGLLLCLLGCPDDSNKQQGQGGQSNTQSQAGASVLDEELKRQGQIYKEILKRNSENAQKHIEADRKLLKQMEKNHQQAKQRELQYLQEKHGLILQEEQGKSSGGQQQGKSSGGQQQGKSSGDSE